MGFLHTPYSAKAIAAPMAAAKSEMARKQSRGFSKTMTANRVAGILENKYSIVEIFQEVYKDEINAIMHESFSNVVMNLLSERKQFASERMVKYMKPKTNRIDKLFRSFLDQEEMNGRPGVPTMAALQGKRFGRKSRSPRPSFIDTGIYRASFNSWVDIK